MLIPHKDQRHGQTFTRWTKKGREKTQSTKSGNEKGGYP